MLHRTKFDVSANPEDDPNNIVVSLKEGISLFSKNDLDALLQMPLPGITIFVHGVNSDGEWYEDAERGLCAGLNARLKRNDEHLQHTGPEAGQLVPTSYMAELTPNGFINPDMNSKTFMQGDKSFSPIIRFRWGYKASGEELQKYGDGIYLNEQNYWGGGPFANGCTSLPDLWGEGIEEELFLFLHVQHLNPTNDRNVYSCPPRPYYVLAAQRLARLVGSIREQQADVPITIVCHSQGNMVGIAAAFLGDAMPEVSDPAGNKGRCVADSYVLCNPPYSLVKSNGTDNWASRHSKDPQGNRGRQTYEARSKTLAAFFDIIRQRAPLQQDAARVDRLMSNPAHQFTAATDRDRYGLNGHTYGRVTLYCNPHDQVISASTVQGIGWRGVSDAELSDAHGDGVFTQRVFSQGFAVGKPGVTRYDYWADQHNKPKAGSDAFWQPESPPAAYSIAKGVDAQKKGFWGAVGTILTFAAAPLFIVGLSAYKVRINANPPKDWKLSLNAPPLPEPFEPKSVRYGVASSAFDQTFDPPGNARNAALAAQRASDESDPYGKVHQSQDGHDDAPMGNQETEASMHYEQHAALRMQAKREGLYKAGDKVKHEDSPESATDTYKAWRAERVKTMLADNIDTHATDHSTIMTNPMHAEKALAYDLAIGCCHLKLEALRQLRIAADWRFADGLERDNPHLEYFEYFDTGKFKELTVFDWAKKFSPIPKKIGDQRDDSLLLKVGSWF